MRYAITRTMTGRRCNCGAMAGSETDLVLRYGIPLAVLALVGVSAWVLLRRK